jgi:PGAP1-like protein
MKVVAIHGIAQNYLSSSQIEHTWLPALQGGLENSGCIRMNGKEFGAVFYGDLFRQKGMRSADIPKLSAQDITKEWEQQLLIEWWKEAAKLSLLNRNNEDFLGEDPSIQSPDFQGRGRSSAPVQRALLQIAKSKFFRKIGSSEKFWIFALKQVYSYIHDLEMKQAILQRVSEKVSPKNTKVIVAHSLGSIVAYEALCKHPEWNVHTLVTLGSPLGVPNLIFDRLTPAPENGVGKWPNVQQWFNIADRGDIVALQKNLMPYFSSNDELAIVDQLVYNGWESHSAENYLTSKETGIAISSGLVE